MANLECHDIMPGAVLITHGDTSILAGIPPEVVKAIMIKKLPVPTAMMIPDRREQFGETQVAAEFPLYYFLFVYEGLKKKLKLDIIGTKEQLADILDLLRITLLGYNQDELLKAGTEKSIVEQLVKEMEFFTLKKPNGQPMSIEDFVSSFHFNEKGKTTYKDLIIEKHGNNEFTVSTNDGQQEKFNLNIDEIQKPPYGVQSDFTPNDIVKLGVEILGGSSGFNPTEASSGLVICYNGIYILVDSIPFITYHLKARGVSKNQIKAIFLTHIHDDHCTMLPLMFFDHKIQIITTKEIYHMAIKKLALTLHMDFNEVATYFDFLEVNPGEPLDYYGLKIDTHYTVHSIPTIGGSFVAKDHHRDYSVTIIGDNQSLKDIRKMAKDGIIPQNRLKTIEKLFTDYVDLLICDGGAGLIHGEPMDAIDSKADRILFIHVNELPKEFNATFSSASAGKRFSLVKGSADYSITRTTEFLLKLYPKINPIWISTLMGDINITHYNKDDVIIKQGEMSKGVLYIILSGYASVVTHDGHILRKMAQQEAGDIIGEMAIVTGDGKRNASIVAESPVSLCEIPEKLFLQFITGENIRDNMINMWRRRALLGEFNILNRMSSQVIARIAKVSEIIYLKEGSSIDSKGLLKNSLSFILRGSIEFNTGSTSKTTLKQGDYFGSIPSLFDLAPYDKGTCRKDTELLHIHGDDIVELCADSPASHFFFKYSFAGKLL